MFNRCLIAASCLFAIMQLAGASTSEERFLEMPLDHFDQQNRETWNMRYYANNVSFQAGGPVFIYVGGDYEIGTYWIENGHMHDIGVELNASFFGIEMRYFGQNQPTTNLSVANLKFLSTEQVLADMATIVDHIKKDNPELTNSKVIMVGTMFGGNLVSWFRAKYPQHVDGVWASSSFVEARMNFKEYLEAIGQDITVFGSNACFRRIRRAFGTIQALINGGRSTVIDEFFRLCTPLDASNKFEVSRLLEAIAESVTEGIINGGYQYAHRMCEDLTSSNNNTNDLIAFSEWFLIEHQSTGCFEMTFEELVDFLAEEHWNDFGAITGRRQFTYLTCTEYGWFATSDSTKQPFGNGITLDYFIEMCSRVYGSWITEESLARNIITTNGRFGGSRPALTNAFFTNGGMDPNRFVNVVADIGDTVEARILSLYGQSRDMYSQNNNDSPYIRDAKNRARELITQWVQN
ncbi:unnamed protein product [Diamesa hyperborea]